MDIRRAAIAAAGGVALAALTLGALPVGAQEPDLLPISVTPTSGPAGTVATVTGSGCVSDGPTSDLIVWLWYGDDPEPILSVAGNVSPDGTWSASVQSEASDPPGTYTLSATCFDGIESDQVVAEYDFVEFELTAPASGARPRARGSGRARRSPCRGGTGSRRAGDAELHRLTRQASPAGTPAPAAPSPQPEGGAVSREGGAMT